MLREVSRKLKKAKAHQKLRSIKSSTMPSRKVPSNLLLPSRRRKANQLSQLEILRAKKGKKNAVTKEDK